MNQHEIELFAAVRPVVTALEQLGVPYCIGGSVASGVFGEPRQTLDADIVAALLARHVPQLAGGLQGEFYVDEPMMMRAIENQSSFNFIHLQTIVKIDVYVAWRSEFARSQFARHLHRNQHPPEQRGKQVLPPHTAEVKDDRGVNDDDHRGGNSRRASKSWSRSAESWC